MNKQDKFTIITIALVIVIAVFVLFFKNQPPVPIQEELAKCIGENSVVYIQNGCSHCIDQEKLFGENFKFINYINCTNNWDSCSEIEGTPTWIINGQKYAGEKSIQELKVLTGC